MKQLGQSPGVRDGMIFTVMCNVELAVSVKTDGYAASGIEPAEQG